MVCFISTHQNSYESLIFSASWQTTELPGNQSKINQLRRTFQISPAFSKILMNRNLSEVEEIEQFLNPSSSRCHNPFLMHDMQKAIDRLYQALLRREKVLIYDDYDVDGTVGTVILYRYLKRIGFRTFYFIQRRLQDGYGMSKATLPELKRKKAEVIITVDNGITAVEVFAWDHFDWYTKLGGACDIAMTFQMRNTSRETLLQFKAIDIKAST